MEPHESPSIIESPREAEIAAVEARAALANAAQKKLEQQAKRRKILKICLIVLAALAVLAVIVAIVWFIVVAVIAARQPVDDPVAVNPPEQVEYALIEGYQCTSEDCTKYTELPDSRIIVRDSGIYYIYSAAEDASFRTTIPEQNFQSISSFTWGDEILAVLEPDTGRSALYSITRNTQLTGFNYDSFYTNPDDSVYQGMTWVIGSYIVATRESSVRLLDVFDGAEIVQATAKVFAYNPYFFGYNDSGERRAYTSSGSQILIAASGDYLFVKDAYLIYVPATSNTSFTIYDANGNKLSSSDSFYVSLRDMLKGQRNYAEAIPQLSGVFTVPQ